MSDSDDIPRVISRGLPNAVTYDLTSPGQVTVTLPSGSFWTSGLHWHEKHTEYLRVVRGVIRVRLGVGGDERIIAATEDDQPELSIDRNQWHEWQRAVISDGEDVMVVERTDPADHEKAIFFWNLNGVILSMPRWKSAPESIVLRWCPPIFQDTLLDLWLTLNLFVIFYYLDNVPAFANFPGLLRRVVGIDARHRTLIRRFLSSLERAFSHFVLSLSCWLGWVLEVKPVRREYTPKGPFEDWSALRDRNGKLKDA